MSKYMMGQSNHNIDPKGRLIVPTRLRDALGMRFVMCRGMDHNINVYPMEEWEKFSERLNSLSVSDKAARQFKTFFQGTAAECEPDGQFRIVIPQNLREHAGIDKELVIVGNGTTAEIWSKDAWDKFNSPEEMDINDIAAVISEKYGF